MIALRIFLVCVLLVYTASAAPPPVPTYLKLCNNALNSCIELNKALDAQAEQLKKDNKELTSKLIDSQKQPLLPTWAWVTISVLTGIVIGAKLIK